MSNAAFSDPETEKSVKERIRDKMSIPRVSPSLTSVPEPSSDRKNLPIRLPPMYYDALKEYSIWTAQSMNAIVVEAIGEFLRSKV